MKKLFFYAVVVGLLVLVLPPQWRSFERWGERRFEALKGPAEEAVVGVCWPILAGQDGMADGLRLAQEEINSGGLAGDFPIRLVMREHDYDEKKGTRIALEFAAMPEMSAVIGYYSSEQAIRASAIYEPSRLLLLILGANSTVITSHGFQYTLRTVLSGDKIAKSLARMSISRGYKKIAVIWAEDAFGEDMAYQYLVWMDSFGAHNAYLWSFSPTRSDFRLPANELKGVDADVIFFAGSEPKVGDFLRRARGVGLKTPIIGTFNNSPWLRKRAGPGLEGVMYPDFYDPDSPRPKNQAFIRVFRARYGKDPDTWAAQGYDALHILAKAMRFTGSRNSLDLAYAIRYMDAWEGANGRYKFDEAGDLEDRTLFLKMVQGGRSVVVGKHVPAPMTLK
ncbi:ABC transporter substrate-binding protein [Elusimicrobiota bacterium]